jgi:hypothetical protein
MWWDFPEGNPRGLMDAIEKDDTFIPMLIGRSWEALDAQGIRSPRPELDEGWDWCVEVDTQNVPHPQAPQVMVPVLKTRVCVETDVELVSGWQPPAASKLILPEKMGGIARP